MPDNQFFQKDGIKTTQTTAVEADQQGEDQNIQIGPTPNNSNETVSSSSSLNHNNAVNHVSTEEPASDIGAKPNITRTITSVSDAGPIYSAFTTSQKRFIVFMASWAGFFSPVSGQIYFPALPSLARDLKVSNTLINLTLVSYMLAQGLAPTFIGDLADNTGRRAAYAVCFLIYIAANLGLALQNSYAALFVLRIFQSAGSSGTIAMASAVVSDVATASERGTYMGYTLAGSLIGPALGPVLGGILTKFLGWRAIFWFLLIMGAAFLVVFGIFFPETARSQVGNGSIPPKGYNMSLMNYLAVRKARKQTALKDNEPETESNTIAPNKRKVRFPNPLSSLHVIMDPSNALLLFYNSFLFAAFYDVTAVIPSQFTLIYNFNSLQIGLCFIPFGCGSLTAALVNGRLLDRNFARWCRKLGIPIRKGRQTDLRKFPIEKARLQIAMPATYAVIFLVLGFGWALQYEAHLAVLLVLLYFTALAMSTAFNVTSTLLVDFYPKRPATAVAANNLTRCWIGAGATAAVIPMVESWGRGWTFTALCLFLLGTSPMLWAVYLWGEKWREQRRLKEEKEEAEKEKKKAEAGRAEEGREKDDDNTDENPTEVPRHSVIQEKEQDGNGGEAQQHHQWHTSGLHRTISHHSTC
jgi:MFS family permease